MRIRIAICLAVGLMAAGCSNSTEPLACDGNPKCKAEQRPRLPDGLQPLTMTPPPQHSR